MTSKQVLARVKALKPTPFDDETLLYWLGEVEGLILVQVLLLQPTSVQPLEAATDDQLTVPYPFDKLYLQYLMAQIDYANGEYRKYDNNYLFGNWTVYVCPWLNKYCGDSRPWILMDSGYNKAYDCAINQNRSELRVTSTIADNDANVWKGRARFAGGFVDFRAFVAGGLSFGASA